MSTTVVVDTEISNEFFCPYCGEGYVDLDIDDAIDTDTDYLCDGEDGCGEWFTVRVI